MQRSAVFLAFLAGLALGPGVHSPGAGKPRPEPPTPMKEGMKSLFEGLCTDRLGVQLHACREVKDLGQRLPGIAMRLGSLLRPEDPRAANPKVRLAAAEALVALGPSAEIAIENLARALDKDPDVRVRFKAAYALGNIGEPAHKAIPQLKDALTDKDISVRERAASALGCIGRRAVWVIPDLEEAAKSKHKDLATFAAKAIRRINKQLDE